METERRGCSEVQPYDSQSALPGLPRYSPKGMVLALTSQHGVLVLGCADEACDPFNDLAFGFQVLFFWFLAQEHHWGPRPDRTNVRMSPPGPEWEPLSQYID